MARQWALLYNMRNSMWLGHLAIQQKWRNIVNQLYINLKILKITHLRLNLNRLDYFSNYVGSFFWQYNRNTRRKKPEAKWLKVWIISAIFLNPRMAGKTRELGGLWEDYRLRMSVSRHLWHLFSQKVLVHITWLTAKLSKLGFWLFFSLANKDQLSFIRNPS